MGTTDPWQQYAVSQAPTPTPAIAAASQSAVQTSAANNASPDPWAQYATNSPAPQAAPQPKQDDEWSKYATGTTPSAPTGNSNPTAGVNADGDEADEGILGKSWDWLNKPLVDLHREGAGGLEQGAEDVASGFTSPLSIGLTALTFGAAPLLEGLGITAAQIPTWAKAAKTAIDLGFTTQQAAGLIKESPQFLDAIKDGDYEEAKRLGVNLVAGGLFAGLGYHGFAKDAGVFAREAGLLKPSEQLTAVRKEAGTMLADFTSNGQNAKAMEVAAREQLGKVDDTTKGAMFRWIEAGGDNNVLQDRYDQLDANPDVADKENTLAKYKAAQSLTPEQIEVAKKVRDGLTDDFQKAYQNGLINSAVENYISHVWGEDESNPAVNRLKTQAGSGQFDTDVSYARQRSFDTSFEGEMLGRQLKNDDPIALAANYRNNIENALSSRDFLERLRDNGTRASDGRALVAISGTGQVLKDEDGNAAVMLADPNRMRSKQIADVHARQLDQNGELTQLLDAGKVNKLGTHMANDPMTGEKVEVPTYGWNTADYKVIDHPAFRDWNYATQDPVSQTPVYLKGDLRVHPEVTDFMRSLVGADKSPIRDFKIGDFPAGRKLLQASTGAKHLLLSFSPFHLVQEGLRAVMTGVNPFGSMKWNIDADPVLRNGVENGLTLGRSYRGLDDFTEGQGGQSGIVSKIPLLGPMQDGLHSFLFDKYIPGLKARAYKSLVDRYADAYPNRGKSEIATMAAQHTNEVFGGLNYKLMGRSMAAQDLFRLGALAPDWLESELRSLHRSLGGDGKIMRQDLARISVYTFAAARVLNLLASGSPHLEAPFGVVNQDKDGKEKVYSFRTLPTDMLHVLSDPMNFIRGRVNPLTVRTGMELLSGRDERGRRVTGGTQAGDLLKNISPIPVQNLTKQFTGSAGDLSGFDQLAKAGGASVYQYRTEAEKLAEQKASDRTETGPVDPQALAAHAHRMQLEDSLRRGDISAGQVLQGLGKRYGQEVIQNSKLSPLAAHVKRLPLADALDVYDLATKGEKIDLSDELLKKRNSFLKSHRGEDVQESAVYQRLKKIYPNLP